MESRGKRPAHRCETCNGSGRVPGMRKVTGAGIGMGSAFGPCPDCDGVGWISDDGDEGRALRLDGVAASADPELPAFIAKPEGAPVYHGFPVLDDVDVHGFRLGMITDWEADSDDAGDAFIVAPDGSRCGLVWEVTATPRFEQVLPFEPGRWGVWSVGFPHPMDSREKARQNLMHLLPQLRERWESWRRGSGSK